MPRRPLLIAAVTLACSAALAFTAPSRTDRPAPRASPSPEPPAALDGDVLRGVRRAAPHVARAERRDCEKPAGGQGACDRQHVKRSTITTAAVSAAAAAATITPAAAQAPIPSAPTAKKASLAKVIVATPARSGPGTGRVVARLSTRAKLYGGANQLLVLDRQSVDGQMYVKVRLPIRPNTAAGWVNADDLVIHTTSTRIVVDLSDRKVTQYKAGRRVRSSKAVIGTRRTPTPTGVFAVSESVPQPRSSKIGSLVIAITAHSDVHKTFDGGDGRVALHGYEKLGDRLGSAASNGCIRLPSSFVKRLAASAEPGTPVIVQP